MEVANENSDNSTSACDNTTSSGDNTTDAANKSTEGRVAMTLIILREN